MRGSVEGDRGSKTFELSDTEFRALKCAAPLKDRSVQIVWIGVHQKFRALKCAAPLKAMSQRLGVALKAQFRALKCAAPLKAKSSTSSLSPWRPIPRTQMRGSVEGSLPCPSLLGIG